MLFGNIIPNTIGDYLGALTWPVGHSGELTPANNKSMDAQEAWHHSSIQFSL